MDTLQLQRILSENAYTKEAFLDVYPSDQLPEIISRYPACFVANASSSRSRGSHWLAFYAASPTELEFFDSYGNSPAYFGGPLSEFAKGFQQVNFNPLTLQSDTTAVCGQYCVYYLLCKCRGQTLKEILLPFVHKNICNDIRVYNYISKRFHVRTKFFQ